MSGDVRRATGASTCRPLISFPAGTPTISCISLEICSCISLEIIFLIFFYISWKIVLYLLESIFIFLVIVLYFYISLTNRCIHVPPLISFPPGIHYFLYFL